MTTPADALRALHEDRPLVLPNVWDAASARAFAAAGFPALATSSAAVVAVLGYEVSSGSPGSPSGPASTTRRWPR